MVSVLGLGVAALEVLFLLEDGLWVDTQVGEGLFQFHEEVA